MTDKPLFVVTGTSGSGKTSMVAPLRTLLGSGWQVWDLDEMVWNLPDHGHPEAPRLTSWSQGDDPKPFHDCKNICLGDAARHPQPVVVCGTLLPQEVFPESRRLFCDIHWCGLHAAPQEIRQRLALRNWPQDLIDLHANKFTWFCHVPQQVEGGMPLIDTSNRDCAAVTLEIMAWIRQLMG